MKQGHRFLIGTLVTVVLALSLIPAMGQDVLARGGAPIYVDADATGANNGSSWADAFTTLQPALDAAVAGTTVWVAEGTYKPTVEHGGTGSRYRSFQMKNGVAIYGGFDPSVGDVAFSDRAWWQNVTILSGDLNGDDGAEFDNNGENTYHVFYHPLGTDLDETAVLDGFTISGGNAEGSAWPHYNGGGMYNWTSSPTLKNCTFRSNRADVRGGAMFNGQFSTPALSSCTFRGNGSFEDGGAMANVQISSPTLVACSFEDNGANNWGGAIYNEGDSSPRLTNCAFKLNSTLGRGGALANFGASPVLTNCTFSVNSSVSPGGAVYNNDSLATFTNCNFSGNGSQQRGGAIYNEDASPTLTDCFFWDNWAGERGGGMYNDAGSSPELSECTFLSNSADSGAGMFNWESSPVLVDCTFDSNTADVSGGGIYNAASSPVLTDCRFEDNSAGIEGGISGGGGGMYNALSSSPALRNCTFWGNSAEEGGGMYNASSSPALTNCTFKGNWTWQTGGAGIYNYLSSPTVTNCILYKNAYPEIYNKYSSPVVTYSDVFGGYPGTGNIDEDPLFVDPVYGDFHLRTGSPCVDKGSNAAPNLPTYDIDGDPRILDGDRNGTAIVDMGVDEMGRRVYLPLVLR